jgi:Na+-transporting methylmalonyl-CoA/oxaloacetate decarboxylase gamma subunit
MLMAEEVDQTIIKSGPSKAKVFLILIILIIASILLATLLVTANKKSSPSYKKYTQIQSKNDKQFQEAKNNDDKDFILSLQVNEAIKAGNIKDAEKYVKKIKDTSGEGETYFVNQAYLAQAKKDKAKAIFYWQKAINSLKPERSGYNLIKNDYQLNINELKK